MEALQAAHAIRAIRRCLQARRPPPTAAPLWLNTIGIQREIVSLRARAEKETQINRRVEFNLAIRRLEGELAKAATSL